MKLAKVPIVHHPDYQGVIANSHRFPMGKFRRVAEILVEDGLATRETFLMPEPALREGLCLAHDPVYVDQVLNLDVPRAIQREIGFEVNHSVMLRARLAAAGTVLAARTALVTGFACNTAGGSHHARYASGAGFCTFNDVAVAICLLREEGLISRPMVIDCDVHQGDGTADIFADQPDVTTVSFHGEKNYPVRKIASSLDIGLIDGCGDEAYKSALSQHLPPVLAEVKPDILFYNAGVDPHIDDKLGRLSLSDTGLRNRDDFIALLAKEADIPFVGVLGGGYSDDVDALARRHTTLHRSTEAVFIGS